MAKADIQVTLEGDAYEGNFPLYHPGELIQGSAVVEVSKDTDCRAVRARLMWHTEGKGDRDEGVIDEQVLQEGMLRAGTPHRYRFSFTAGETPWSYIGKLITIIWEVEVMVDVAWARDPRGSQLFILRPEAR